MPGTDARTIEALYRKHGHAVLRRARRILGNEADARDVLQDVFASMLDDGSSFRGESAITTWLYSATTHRCLNRIRNTKSRARILQRERPSGEVAAPENAENAAIVRDLLTRLPDNLAIAAIHYYVDEMTHDEIAKVLGCSRRHVGDLIERLHDTLRASADTEEAS
ncbi:RNA polymerase, sigma-24 subunit, ECF subfamily [Labilithrix luteola]|uniref:RNA polymerase, sigma-24 subunit, ECF subfamily n=1 Tax=Labilithrix luteola TaxID=1391654 RepID=A0A0K1QC39_9BACT|nr:sigma-70 family RNA polymerase sigma factor [Labilithrix luteola]AKV03314.1 RNA polymerase, sigma-24 subunit, ECF subfamily [Labilithrix luteola]